MRSTMRLAKPITLKFEHRGHTREEAITHITFESIYDDISRRPDEAMVESIRDALSPAYHYDGLANELRGFDLKQAVLFAYVDAGFRASIFIDAKLGAADADETPTLDVSHLIGRKITHRDVVGDLR